MRDTETQKSLEESSRSALARLEELQGIADVAMQRLGADTRSAAEALEGFASRIESVCARANSSYAELHEKLGQAKAEESRTNTVFAIRRAGLRLLIVYYRYRWTALRVVAVGTVAYLLYDNRETLMDWANIALLYIESLFSDLWHLSTTPQKPAQQSGGGGQ
jgi:hypothetical protein